MTAVAVDFDGTVAVTPIGTSPAFHDPHIALCRSAALPAAVRWLRLCILRNYDVHLVTGRDEHHRSALNYWCLLFIGHRLNLSCRPPNVGLSCASQATWKADVFRTIGAHGAIGDNDRIDRAAARMAGIPYLDARVLRVGALPRLDPATGWHLGIGNPAPDAWCSLPAWPDTTNIPDPLRGA